MNARIRLQRIESTPVTLHFSPGYSERAQRLGELVTEAHIFLSEWLGVEARSTLSVLRQENWRRLRRVPYGYPHSNLEQGMIFAPAHYPPRLIERARALYESAPEALQRALCDRDGDVRSHIVAFYDLVAVHELGHLFIHHLQLALGLQWLTELVANLFALAYFVERRPEAVKCWLAWADIQVSTEVPHRGLKAYEAHYATLDFTNASYYQGRFNRAAYELWQEHGRSIKEPLIAQFSLTEDAVQGRFRQVAPTFTWNNL